MLDRREHFMREFDWIRTALMFEPRGHAMMSGSMLYPSSRDDCDIGVLYIETSGCLAMCGHGTIGTVTVAIEKGLVKPRTEGELHLETPAGKVVATYTEEGGRVKTVKSEECTLLPACTGPGRGMPGVGWGTQSGCGLRW